MSLHGLLRMEWNGIEWNGSDRQFCWHGNREHYNFPRTVGDGDGDDSDGSLPFFYGHSEIHDLKTASRVESPDQDSSTKSPTPSDCPVRAVRSSKGEREASYSRDCLCSVTLIILLGRLFLLWLHCH